MSREVSKAKKPEKEEKKTKYIFVTGGVMSGVGKGVTTASIGQILQARGYKVSAVKMDPYINVDAGTMNPIEHGEVFVTEDGDETDQDIGNYERFLNKNIVVFIRRLLIASVIWNIKESVCRWCRISRWKSVAE